MFALYSLLPSLYAVPIRSFCTFPETLGFSVDEIFNVRILQYFYMAKGLISLFM